MYYIYIYFDERTNENIIEPESLNWLDKDNIFLTLMANKYIGGEISTERSRYAITDEDASINEIDVREREREKAKTFDCTKSQRLWQSSKASSAELNKYKYKYTNAHN